MKLIFTLSLLLCCLVGFSQIKNTPFEYTLEAGGQYNTGYSNINTLLERSNLNDIPTLGMNAGFRIGYQFKHITAGISTNFARASKQNNELSSSTSTIYISTNTLKCKRFIISPQLGFGPKFSTLLISKKDMTGSFDDFLTSKSNQTRIEHMTTVLDIGLVLKKINHENTFFSPIFKIGYAVGLENGDWEISNSTVTNSPKDRTGTIYAQLLFGFGKVK